MISSSVSSKKVVLFAVYFDAFASALVWDESVSFLMLSTLRDNGMDLWDGCS